MITDPILEPVSDTTSFPIPSLTSMEDAATILILDNEPWEATLLKTALEDIFRSEIDENEAVRVETATNIPAAIDALQAITPESGRTLVVADYHLGGATALDFLEQLPAALRATLGVVICSSFCPPDMKTRVSDDCCPVLEILEKPFDLDGYQALSQRIRHIAHQLN
jgi:CheY-like chemotaxis protein